MNIATRIAQHFGLTPLHDVDLPDEPSASMALPWPPNLADSSPRHGSPGEDGPTASVPTPGAVGHPNDWPVDWDAAHDDLDSIRKLPEILNDCTRAGLSAIIAKMSAIVEAATEVVQIVDRIQSYETPPEQLGNVTYIDIERI